MCDRDTLKKGRRILSVKTSPRKTAVKSEVKSKWILGGKEKNKREKKRYFLKYLHVVSSVASKIPMITLLKTVFM